MSLHIQDAEHLDGGQFGGTAAEGDEDGQREGEGGAEGGQDQGDRQAAPVVLGYQRQAEDAAPHQDADGGQRHDPDQGQFLAPEAAHAGDDVEADEQQDDDGGAPLLVVGVAAEQDQPIFVVQDRPAGADALEVLADRGVGDAGVAVGHGPDGVDDAPSEQGDQSSDDEVAQRQGDGGGPPGPEQIGACPGPGADRRDCRLRSGFGGDVVGGGRGLAHGKTLWFFA